jgi:thiol-disulfide isomerase/thioredoxin
MGDSMRFRSKAGLWLAAVFGLALSAAVQAASPPAPQVLAVYMYADWCKACAVLDPKLKAVQPEFERGKILFVRLDLTNERTVHQAGMLAQALGIGALYEKNAGKTGYVALVDRASGRTIERITKDHSEQDIRTILGKAAK